MMTPGISWARGDLSQDQAMQPLGTTGHPLNHHRSREQGFLVLEVAGRILIPLIPSQLARHIHSHLLLWTYLPRPRDIPTNPTHLSRRLSQMRSDNLILVFPLALWPLTFAGSHRVP